MADYIRRDIVLKIINTVNDTGGFAGYADYCVLFDEIDTMPASDVQPIKHGRWEYYKNNGIINTYICTNCQGKVEMAIDVEPSKFKYCPNCGARLIGGEKEQ